jgi:hypothetical protein
MGLTFDPETHTYTLDGLVVPSVTQVLRASGLVDFGSIPPTLLDAAQLRGTKVHQAVQYFNEHDLDVGEFCGTFPAYAGYLQSWIALFASGRLKTCLCERRVASRKHRYAGTIDWLGEFDGRGALIDFATGDPEDVAKDLQTAAYHAAAVEWQSADRELGAFIAAHPILARYSVRLKKDGRLAAITPYQDPRHLSEFITLVSARRIVEARKGDVAAWAA